MSIEKTFRIIATPTEAGLSAEQTLVYNAGDLAFWLDPSDETTYAEIPNGETPASTPTVRRLIEKAYSASVRFKKKAVADVDAPINRVYFARQGLDLLTGYVYTNGNPLQPSAIDVSSQLTPGSFSVLPPSQPRRRWSQRRKFGCWRAATQSTQTTVTLARRTFSTTPYTTPPRVPHWASTFDSSPGSAPIRLSWSS